MRARSVGDFLYEDRIGDLLRKTDKNINLHTYINKEFVEDTKLIKKVVLDQYYNLKWNNTEHHDMIKRIKNRTSFKSISEFNQSIKELMENFFRTYGSDLAESYISRNKLSVSLKNTKDNYYILFSFPPEGLFRKSMLIYMITIMNGDWKRDKGTDIEIIM